MTRPEENKTEVIWGEPKDRRISSPGTRALKAKLTPEAMGHVVDDPAGATKDTNPKDAIGQTKLSLSLVPQTAIAMASLAHLNGALKYGRFNWRRAGVRASIYLDAARRHLAKWEDGEELDEDGVPHLASVLASINIIVDARACGKLNDDRPLPAGMTKFFEALTPEVQRLTNLHRDKTPRHFTIADVEK